MTKSIEFVPQGNPTTEGLKLSIACQLLLNRIQTMEVTFTEDPSHYSTDDWEDFILASKFLNTMGKKLTVWESVEDYLAIEYAVMNQKYNNHPTR
jgi:hypothetical protein